MRANRLPIVAVAVLVALLAVSLLQAGMGQLASAAPLPAPTPITVSAADDATLATFWRAKQLVTTSASSAIELPKADRLDLQWIVDEGAITNTTDLKLQFSNDGSNWVDGLAVADDIVADANDMQQFNIFGRYIRVYATLTSTNPITITAIGVAK